jgi:hypothetical protein
MIQYVLRITNKTYVLIYRILTDEKIYKLRYSINMEKAI